MNPDTASHGTPQHDSGELRHTMTVHQVEAALQAAGVPRSHRQVIRYCESGLLDAVKVPGPTGDQWYVAPASLPKAIGDLKQWEAQRAGHGTPEHAMSNHDTPQTPPNTNSDTARHGAPKPAMSDQQERENPGQGSETQPDTVRHTPTDLDIFAHPYVKKLEERNEKLEAKYEAQVRRTEQIQTDAQKQLIELHRMTAVGQSETLANFMLKARGWLSGGKPDDVNPDVPPAQAQQASEPPVDNRQG
jgi:type VI protein secretion system component VasF